MQDLKEALKMFVYVVGLTLLVIAYSCLLVVLQEPFGFAAPITGLLLFALVISFWSVKVIRT